MRVNKIRQLLATGSIPLGNTGDRFTYDQLVKILKYLASYALLFGGIVAMGAVVFYGFQMVMSKGDPGKFNEAKGSLIKAAIGAALIFGVFTIIATLQGAASSLNNYLLYWTYEEHRTNHCSIHSEPPDACRRIRGRFGAQSCRFRRDADTVRYHDHCD